MEQTQRVSPLEMTAVMQEPFALVTLDRTLVLLAETGLSWWIILSVKNKFMINHVNKIYPFPQ